MTDQNTCLREIEVEIPADQVTKETNKVVREISRVARVPGFRPGKAPAEIVRRRYWDDIRSEVIQNLIPDSLEEALKQTSYRPLSRPEIVDLDFEPNAPVRYKAAFEILPEIKLGKYKGLVAPRGKVELTQEHVEEELNRMRERHATFEPVEGRAAKEGDTVVADLSGEFLKPEDEAREPITLEHAEIQLGSDQTLAGFREGLTGVRADEERSFTVDYPADYHEPKLAGAGVKFTAKVTALRRKVLPKLDDEFARSHGDYKTMKEMRKAIKDRLKQSQAAWQKQLTEQNVLDALLAAHDFPVPEVLVAQQVNARLERRIGAMISQGIDPRTLDVDWRRLQEEQRSGAIREVQIGLLLEKIAEAENLEPGDQDVTAEVERMAAQTGQKAEEMRSRLTKDGGLDRIKSAVRSDKVVEFLISHAKLTTKDED